MEAELAPLQHERGFGLIEVLITVAIVSIAFVAILSAMSAMIATGATHREITQTEALARNAAEFVKSSSVTYADCATPATYNVPLGSLPISDAAHYTASVSAVKVWDGNDPAGYAPSAPGCTDPGVQQVTVTVAHTGGVSQTVSVVKRQA